MKRRLSTAYAAVLVAGGGLVPAGAAAVDGGPLPLQKFADIEVDDVNGRVFVSGGLGTNGVVVADMAGNVLQTLPNLPGAAGMVLSPDSASLYVALRDGDGVAVIHTTDLTVTKIATGVASCPQHLAVAAGLVWFGYGCQGGSGDLGAIDPNTREVYRSIGAPLFYSAPLLASAPLQRPDTLLAGTPGQSPSTLHVLKVTGGSAPTAVSTAARQVGENLRDLAVTPGGEDVIVADGAVYYHQVFSTSDLSANGNYPSDAYPNAIAVGHDGTVAAGIDGAYSDDIYLYEPDATAPYRTEDFGSAGTSGASILRPKGLAFGGDRLYAVTGDSFSGSLQLRVITEKVTPDPEPTSLDIGTDKRTYNYGETARIVTHLGPTASNRTVSVFATPFGGGRRLLETATVDSNGTLVVSARVFKRTTFTAEFAGDDASQVAQANVVISARAEVASQLRGHYGRSGRYHMYRPRRRPKLLTEVRPNHAGDCMYFRAQILRRGSWRRLAVSDCMRLDTYSGVVAVLRGTRRVGDRIRMRAEWRGDQENAPTTAGWKYVKVSR